MFAKFNVSQSGFFDLSEFEVQEVFHVYLNKFAIAVSHLFLLYLVIINLHWLI